MKTPPSDRSDTRGRIVEAARYLFWEKGYAATGLSELFARAQANSGSFYHFFESKDALLRTVLDTYAELLAPHVVRPAFDASRDPIARVFVLLDGYRQRLIDTGCRYGCPIGRLALEIDPENTPAHGLIARNFSAWRDAVEGCFRAAGLRDAAELAAFTLTVMEGGVMQSRAYRSIEPFDACVRQLRAHLAAAAKVPPIRGPRRKGRRAVKRTIHNTRRTR